MLKDLISNIELNKMLKAATRTGDANSSSVDNQGARALVLEASIGTSGDTLSGSVKIELEVEHSDDNSSWSDCANSDLSSYVTGTNTGTFAVIDAPGEDDQIYKTAYKGSKRYVRVVANFTGTHTNGTPLAVTGIAGKLETMPAA
jgi:hypothetical protein